MGRASNDGAGRPGWWWSPRLVVALLSEGGDEMPKKHAGMLFLPLTLDPSSAVPLYRQLYDGLRQAILMGELAAGTQLPSTRILASRLGISRTTVVLAFDQLLSEGYVEGKAGSGTYVASVLPDNLLYKPAFTRMLQTARPLQE